MAKTTTRKPYDEGLTADELTEVKTLEKKVQAQEAAPDPPASMPPEEEIACLREDITKAEARIWMLEHPEQPFPKMVKGRVFADQAELDAAGPEYS